MGPRIRVLDEGAHRRHLANTIERSVPCAAAMRPYIKLAYDVPRVFRFYHFLCIARV